MSFCSQFAGRTVLVVGDVMLDEYILGHVRRLSPEAPVPIVEIHQRRYHPGGAANVAANIASLNGNSALVGIAGADAAGDKLIEALAGRSISTAGVIRDNGAKTITKTRVMAGGHHIVRFDDEQRVGLSAGQERAIGNMAADYAEGADAVVISDYGKAVATPAVCRAIIDQARERHIPVVVDPKGTDYSKYAGATLITPNLGEAKAVAGAYDSRFLARDDSGILIEDLTEVIMAHCDANLLITRGPDGMTVFERACPPVTIRAEARDVFDVTGAGDTVVATIALALSVGLPLERACRAGNQAAGIVVGEIGACAIPPEKLDHAIAADPAFSHAAHPVPR